MKQEKCRLTDKRSRSVLRNLYSGIENCISKTMALSGIFLSENVFGLFFPLHSCMYHETPYN